MYSLYIFVKIFTITEIIRRIFMFSFLNAYTIFTYIHGFPYITHCFCLYGRNAWQNVCKDSILPPYTVSCVLTVLSTEHTCGLSIIFGFWQITSQKTTQTSPSLSSDDHRDDCWQLTVTFYRKPSVIFAQQAFCVPPHSHLVYSTEMQNGTLKQSIHVKVISPKKRKKS